jgi:hypothetical protein
MQVDVRRTGWRTGSARVDGGASTVLATGSPGLDDALIGLSGGAL